MCSAPTATTGEDVAGRGNTRLAILLAMAMFVLVVDTSLMNVSISAVVRDLGTTVSGVQSAIALEALVSAAFILIGSKVGDLIGRKRAYVLGLLGYAVGALAMALAQGLTAVIIFWAVIGGIGASLLLPAMQSLIHGNFEGAAQKQVYALVGAAAAIAAAVGPLLGGFITTYLSWRVGFVLEVVIIAIVLSRHQTRPRRALHRAAHHRRRRARCCPCWAWAALVLGILVWQEGGESVAALLVTGVIAMAALVVLADAAQACREADADRPGSVHLQAVPVRDLRTDAPADRPGRRHDRAADLPADGARVQRAAGRPVPRPALAQHVRHGAARREESRASAAPPASSGWDSRCSPSGIAVLIPIVPRAEFGWALIVPLADRGLGAGPAGVAAQQLHAGPDLGGAGQRGRRRELGGWLVRAVVRAGVRRRHHAGDAVVHLHQHGRSQHRAPARRAATGRTGAGGERGADDQHTARTAAGRPTPGRSRPRSSASTPKRDPSPFRWHCSSRCSPGSSGCSTPSA